MIKLVKSNTTTPIHRDKTNLKDTHSMPKITIQLELSEQRQKRFAKMAAALDTTPDILTTSLVESYLDNQEIADRSMSTREIHHVVAHSPLNQYLIKDEKPTIVDDPSQPTNLTFRVDYRLMPKWERLIVTQDVGLPLWWNARLVNVSEDDCIGSPSQEQQPEAFSHQELTDALQSLHHKMNVTQPR